MSFVGVSSYIVRKGFFFVFLVGGGEKEPIEDLYYRSYRNVPSSPPIFSLTSDKEPPVHFGKEKEKR